MGTLFCSRWLPVLFPYFMSSDSAALGCCLLSFIYLFFSASHRFDAWQLLFQSQCVQMVFKWCSTRPWWCCGANGPEAPSPGLTLMLLLVSYRLHFTCVYDTLLYSKRTKLCSFPDLRSSGVAEGFSLLYALVLPAVSPVDKVSLHRVLSPLVHLLTPDLNHRRRSRWKRQARGNITRLPAAASSTVARRLSFEASSFPHGIFGGALFLLCEYLITKKWNAVEAAPSLDPAHNESSASCWTVLLRAINGVTSSSVSNSQSLHALTQCCCSARKVQAAQPLNILLHNDFLSAGRERKNYKHSVLRCFKAKIKNADLEISSNVAFYKSWSG